MTEDQNDQTTGQEPVSGAESPSAATPGGEATDAANPMPEASTPEPSEATVPPTRDAASTPTETTPAGPSDTSLPQQPDTPPQGIPQNLPQGPPTGAYAMGALAGNPALRPLRPVDTVTTACATDSSPAERHWSCWPPA
jgi:hypothetical protein